MRFLVGRGVRVGRSLVLRRCFTKARELNRAIVFTEIVYSNPAPAKRVACLELSLFRYLSNPIDLYGRLLAADKRRSLANRFLLF